MMWRTAPVIAVVWILGVGLAAPGAAMAGAATMGVSDNTARASASVRAFEPAYFADHDPETAWDLIAHVPGFTTVLGGGGGRGLAGGAGNILLDGRRPPAKTTSIQSLLRDVPLARVQRIEVIEAGARDLDFAGHPYVLNIISTPVSRPTGEVSLGARQTGSNSRTDTAGLRGQYRFGAHSVRGSTSLSRGMTETPGQVLPATPSRPFERETAGSKGETRSTSSELSADLTLRRDARLSLNAFLADTSSASASIPPKTSNADLVLTASSRTTMRERFGAELSLPGLWGADWRLNALQSHQSATRDSRRSSLEGGEAGITSQSEQGETAARLSAFLTLTDAWRADLAVSAAHNFLQGASEQIRDGERAPIPGSNARVDEIRASAEAGLSWTSPTSWNADAGLRVDWSELSQDAAGEVQTPSQTLVDFAPRARLSVTPWTDSELRFRLERQIGQLAFSQFLATASLDEDRRTAGAGRLEPERQWIGEAVLEHRWDDAGMARLTAQKTLLENPIRTIPTPDGAQRRANVDEAIKQSLAASLSTPLDVIDLPGVTLSASVTARRSEIIDPVTGQSRAVSGQSPVQWRIGWRQVLGEGDVIWGASLSDAAAAQSFGLSNLSRADADPAWNAFVEFDVSAEFDARIAVTGQRRAQSSSTLFSGLRGASDSILVQDTLSETETSVAINAQWHPRSWIAVEADYNTGAATSALGTRTLLADGVISTSERLVDAVPVAALRLRLTH